MEKAPKQNWIMYEALAASHEAAELRGMTPTEKFAIYADLFNLVRNARSNQGNWARLDEWSWQQKLETRQRMVLAFGKLDEIQHARAAASDAA
jgi:hypothetical protein